MKKSNDSFLKAIQKAFMAGYKRQQSLVIKRDIERKKQQKYEQTNKWNTGYPN